jgi:hypothetical protein
MVIWSFGCALLSLQMERVWSSRTALLQRGGPHLPYGAIIPK